MAIGHVMRYTPYSRKIKQIGTHTSLSVLRRTCESSLRSLLLCGCVRVQSIVVCWAN
jgi:hypothetical protein